MKPLPAQSPNIARAADSAMPSLPTPLANPPASYSKANRRATGNPGQRVYPWLLFASTIVSATFCLLYISKPVIAVSSAVDRSEEQSAAIPENRPIVPVKASLMPNHDRLPGEKALAGHDATAKSADIASHGGPGKMFEQTNLRIQHILTAETPGGQLAKIDLDVPVLYQSRNLRWTAAEVMKARELLARLADYQEKSQTLRAEGAELLDSWNSLIGSSIPAGELRADSPTLPTNQRDAADAPRPAGLDTTELIKIQPTGK